MNFCLSDQHKLQQELYFRFSESEIKPLAGEMDEAEHYSEELLNKLKECGFFGIPFPREYGGAGADTLSYALCMEEVSKVDASTGITLSVHTSLCCDSIYKFGNEEQKQSFLRPLLDGSKIGCFGLTESNAGSDPEVHVLPLLRVGMNTYLMDINFLLPTPVLQILFVTCIY